MDNMNDIRMTLGAMRNRLNDVYERIARLEKVADIADQIDAALSELPDKVEDMIKRLEADPMMGTLVAPILAPVLRDLAAQIEKHRSE